MTALQALPLHPPATHRRHVLFADDEEQIGLLVKRLLERAGHDVECVGDGELAWARVAANPTLFDFVVVDQQMPGCSGLELVEKLRSIGYAGKIIIQSGRLTKEEEDAFRALPVHQILCKPGDVLRLVEIVNGESPEISPSAPKRVHTL